MAKKPKILEQLAAAADTDVPAANGDSARPSPERRTPRKPRKVSTRSRKTTAQPARNAEPELREDAIRMRAYFISEQRMRMSLPGDADSDWIEARRQLLAELGRE